MYKYNEQLKPIICFGDTYRLKHNAGGTHPRRVLESGILDSPLYVILRNLKFGKIVYMKVIIIFDSFPSKKLCLLPTLEKFHQTVAKKKTYFSNT